MLFQGITVDDMFRNTDWRRDSREVVLSAVRVARPGYNPPLITPITHYNSVLVNHLNEAPVSIFYLSELDHHRSLSR